MPLQCMASQAASLLSAGGRGAVRGERLSHRQGAQEGVTLGCALGKRVPRAHDKTLKARKATHGAVKN